VRPYIRLDDKQQATGGVSLRANHGNAEYSVGVTDAGVRGGDVLDGLRLGVKLHDGSLQAIYEPNTGHHVLRVANTVSGECREPCRGPQRPFTVGSHRHLP
jgi:hypothetical protein